MRQQHRKRTQMRQLLDDALVQVGSLVVWHGSLAPWTLAIYSRVPCKKFRPSRRARPQPSHVMRSPTTTKLRS
jgi:hypothetical protein